MKDIDDVVYEVDCSKIIKGAVNVNTGANASAEGEDAEDLEEGAEQVIDIVDGFRLVSMPFADKKQFTGQLKGMDIRILFKCLLSSWISRLPQESDRGLERSWKIRR